MSVIPYGELLAFDITVDGKDEKIVVGQIHFAFVIPCRDCIHTAFNHGNDFEARPYWCCRTGTAVEVDGFCAWGERSG